MTTRLTNRFRPSIDALEHREAPTGLTTSPPGWINAEVPQFIAAYVAESDAAKSHDRAFHAKDSGIAVLNGPPIPGTTISASASGHATHLGEFTLHDTSTIVGFAGGVLTVDFGEATLVTKHGNLYATFSGSVDFNTGQGTVYFEWTGGTGRFANATGATVWQLSVNPDLTYTAVADGVISY